MEQYQNYPIYHQAVRTILHHSLSKHAQLDQTPDDHLCHRHFCYILTVLQHLLKTQVPFDVESVNDHHAGQQTHRKQADSEQPRTKHQEINGVGSIHAHRVRVEDDESNVDEDERKLNNSNDEVGYFVES